MKFVPGVISIRVMMIEKFHELAPRFIYHVVSDEHVEKECQSHQQKEKNDIHHFTSINFTKKQRANHRRNQHENCNTQHADIHDIAQHRWLPLDEPADREGQCEA
jgi:hypothetical protein